MKKGDGHDPSPALFCFCVRFSGPLRRMSVVKTILVKNKLVNLIVKPAK